MIHVLTSSEVSFTHKIDYKEINGVDYGFVPSSNEEMRRFGFMRFKPRAVKAIGKNAADVVSFLMSATCRLPDTPHSNSYIFNLFFSSQKELHVLTGEFTLHCDGENIEVYGGTDVSVPAGARYGLTNRGDYVGIIEFTYAS